jgi:hypothetical protein
MISTWRLSRHEEGPNSEQDHTDSADRAGDYDNSRLRLHVVAEMSFDPSCHTNS